MRIKFYLAAVFVLSLMSTRCFAVDEINRGPYVRVVGEGEVKIKPDQVILNFGIESADPDIKKAQQDNAKRTDSFLFALKKIGILEKNIQTTVAQINPRYDYVNGRQRFVEYVALKSFTVQLDNVASYGSVLQASIDAGVNQTSGVQFDHSKRKDFEMEALKKAVEDAHKKAEVLSSAAGKKVGDPIEIESTSVEAPVPMFRAKFAAIEQVPADQVAPGEITIRSSVNVKFQLK